MLAVDVALLVGLAIDRQGEGLGHHRPPVVGVAASCLACPAADDLAARRAARRAEPRPGAKCRRRAARTPGRRRCGRRRGAARRPREQQRGSLSAGELLTHGAVVWLTNIITFGLLFWQLDEGGPRVLRAERGRPDPDFQFPQDAVRPNRLEPTADDYLYVSLTNAIAVSPTDTMPLTRRAKGLMAVESLISYAVAILVISRAVNILGT